MIKNRKSTVNFIITYLFFLLFITVSVRNFLNPILPVVSEELGLKLDQIGSLLSISFIGLLIASIITGNLIEIFGYKKIILLGILSSIIGSISLYFSLTYSLLMISYFILQFSIGISVTSMLAIVGNITKEKIASNVIKSHLGHSIAFVSSPLLISLMIYLSQNWRNLFIYFLLPQIFLIVLLFFLKIPMKMSNGKNIKTIFKTNIKIISSFRFILYGIITFFYGAISGTFFSWFTFYFTTLGVEVKVSSLFLSIYGVSLICGMLLKSKLLNHFSMEKFLPISYVICLVSLLGVLLTRNMILKNIFVFTFGASISGNFPITFSLATEIFPNTENFCSSLITTFTNAGIIIFQYVNGFFSEYFSKSSVLYIDIVLVFINLILAIVLVSNTKYRPRLIAKTLR